MIAGVVMNVLQEIVIYCGVCWGDNEGEDAKWGYNFNEGGAASASRTATSS